jgi:hypothetical protein
MITGAVAAQAADTRYFEMRTYYAAPGKLAALQARFRDNIVKQAARHDMTNIGYWVPVENATNKLVQVLAFTSRAGRDKAFAEFGADPNWYAARQVSAPNGQLVLKIESVFLQATDFSPAIKLSAGDTPRTFELRTYKCTPNHLPNLLTRFREHTLKLFAKHGMTSIAYWTPTDKDQGADDTLIYLLAHKSKEAAAESFKNFRADPDWIKAKADSERVAGGSLTIKDGVQSEFLQPTDFSPMR